MGFVDDNEVESTNRERLILGVNVVNHRLVGTKNDSSVKVNVILVTLVTQYRNGSIRQQLREILLSLVN